MNLQQIDAAIKRVKGTTSSVNSLIQDTAVAIIAHAKEHGDVTRALSLVQAMPASFRREMLVNWFAYYAPIGMNVNKGIVKQIDAKSKRFRNYDVDGAKANPWFDPKSVPENVRPEPLPDTLLELSGNIVKFVERMRAKVEDPKAFKPEHKKEALDMLDQFESLAKRGLKGAEIHQLEQQIKDAKREYAKTGNTMKPRARRAGQLTSRAVKAA